MNGEKNQTREKLAAFRRITVYDRLIASGTYPNVRTFMKEFEISESTVNRDLADLRDYYGAGNDLMYNRFHKGFYYANPLYRLPALLTTEKQIVAAQLVSNLLTLIKGTPIYKQAIEVFIKLSNNIEQDSALDAKKLNNRLLFLGMDPVAIDDGTWSQIERAMSGNNYITFDYIKEEKTYTIEVQPLQLIFYTGMWTLYAFNTEYKKTRFYLDWVLAKGMFIVPLEPAKLVEDWKMHIDGMSKLAKEGI